MILINLLPWREQAREESKRRYFYGVGGAVGASLAVIAFVHFGIAYQMKVQESRNGTLERVIAEIDQQLAEMKDYKKQKEALLNKIHIVRELQSMRPLTVHLFDEIVTMLPKGVHLTQFDRQENKLSIMGIAESNTNVSELMRNIEKSAWLTKPLLSQIKTDPKLTNYKNEFSMEMTLVNNRGAHQSGT